MVVLVLGLALLVPGPAQADDEGAPATKEEAKVTASKVLFKTNMGDMVIELYPEKAPISVENFLSYVTEGFFDGLIFHRVIPGFVIQGGGFTPDMKKRDTHKPIENEAGNGLKNLKGTLSMARTNEINSATSQFFVNLTDNESLDHRGETPQGFGYAVFGKVVKGMEVVEAIAKVPTGKVGMYSDVPKEPVIIEKASIVGDEQ
ncbi:MAG: peptidyl-prolyl cis-trans isomerase [Candidatus Eisenbacteria bacterium]|uniref:Peptidyl-prolyl cis-trans isomerase n=1 Tax=Eiseniibacteriota bacterium TaxID=2212470 RepID=A0A948RWE1_UNCEI|nr:peptidyl-prolyl cis-trans isomerase [Candidatus Eisenbacteria bacterium]MBU1948484.1 peptidyl-prolyl cis-trans isomerase [Candidatus Eisenbacteria bacterium]MBU2689494.1 peptidyl-prolyl cis-trans isomerase [Candidatus Eisenbacteria bacterium]